MSNSLTATALLAPRLLDVFAETAWPLMLLSAGGQILVVSRPMGALLGADETTLLGVAVDTLVAEEQREALRSALHQAATSDPPLIRTRLRHASGPPLVAELRAFALPEDEAHRVTLIVYPHSLKHRREQLMLELNRLAPSLLAAQSTDEVFSRAAQALRRTHLQIAALLVEPGGANLRIHYTSLPAPQQAILQRAASMRLTELRIPAAADPFHKVLTQQLTLFWPDFQPVLEVSMPPEAVALTQLLLRLQGIKGFIAAPIVYGEHDRGVLVIWGHVLSGEDVPFIEAFAHQIAAVLVQLRLLADQQHQRQGLAALLRMSEAVNRSLDLDIILQEGLRTLDDLGLATMAGVSLLNTEGTHIEMRAHLRVPEVMVRNFGRLELAQLGIVTRALQTGEIQVLSPAEIALYYPTYPGIESVPLSSSIFVPLIADGRALGTLNVGHVGQPYTDQNLQLLQAIAQQLAHAVVKAQAHQSLQASAAENARLYRQAEEVRTYLNTLIQTSPDALLVVRRDLTVRLLNPERLTAWSGYRSEEIEGHSLLTFLPERYHAELTESRNATPRDWPHNIEVEFLKADRSRARVLLSSAYLTEYDEVLMLCKDVTEQRRSEAQMRQNEKLAALGQMVAGAAHELNNPLSIILGLAQLQNVDELTPALGADIKGIEAAALRAHMLVRQILGFARPPRPHPQPLDVETLIHSTLRRVVAEDGAGTIRTTVVLPVGLPAIGGDPGQIEQALFNIMHNATQALMTNPKEAPRELSIYGRSTPNMVHLTIADTGPGIMPQDMPHIFDPFFTTRETGQGTGLGLAIVYAIIHQHGGRVWAESARGSGTTFHIELPSAAPAQPDLPAAEPEAPLAAHARILLVDDEELIRSVVTRTLISQNYIVDSVASGEEALQRAQIQEYALVVSDLQMPGMDGRILYERLHRMRPALRWLILTGDTMGEQSRDFLERTELTTLAKPFTRDQLLDYVATCLSD
jgi:PAS domain S-box-containing protein